MNIKIFETIVGFMVLVITLICLFKISTHQSGSNFQGSYKLYSKFQNIEGLSKGSDVMISGIKVGVVSNLEVDLKDYNAAVELSIYKNILIPADSSASIVSNGFIGGKYVSISAGIEPDFIKEKGKFKYTHSAISLESLIGKFIYSFQGK